jgi:hypothetical protein
MTICDIVPAAKAAKYSWKRMAAMSAGILLAAVGAGGKALAAVDCASPANHAAATQCPAQHPRTGVHGGSKAQQTIGAKTVATVEGDELTPLSAAVASSRAVAAQRRAALAADAPAPGVKLPNVALPASALVDRVGRDAPAASPWHGRGAPQGNLWPHTAESPTSDGRVTADMNSGSGDSSLADLLHGAGGVVVPAPAAWIILLVGLLGLSVLARGPRVARVKAWATSLPSPAGRSGSQATARGWAIDRMDPERYV